MTRILPTTSAKIMEKYSVSKDKKLPKIIKMHQLFPTQAEPSASLYQFPQNTSTPLPTPG